MSWEELKEALDRDTMYSSSLTRTSEHWAHVEIVRRMREDPFCNFLHKMVEDVRNNTHWWTIALYQVFEDGPVIPEESRGVFKDINKLWLDWLAEKGYID